MSMRNFKSRKLTGMLREIEKENYNNMRDVLLNKGYSVAYENFPSGHDYLGWSETLATGLIALIGM